MFSKFNVLAVSLIVVFHFALLAFCVKTNSNTGIGLDEARFLPAGVYHWLREGFEPANDSPPLARMIAALPLLPLGVNLPPGDPGARGVDASPNVLDNELWYGGALSPQQ